VDTRVPDNDIGVATLSGAVPANATEVAQGRGGLRTKVPAHHEQLSSFH